MRVTVLRGGPEADADQLVLPAARACKDGACG